MSLVKVVLVLLVVVLSLSVSINKIIKKLDGDSLNTVVEQIRQTESCLAVYYRTSVYTSVDLRRAVLRKP
ncbi:hypothetical protein [uncultured Mesonia sp.]|uniref:hypothetical protein n=1 Tax=uncultured Mesonia sp. TaxID=399731 RepID=UPI00374EC64D